MSDSRVTTLQIQTAAKNEPHLQRRFDSRAQSADSVIMMS